MFKKYLIKKGKHALPWYQRFGITFKKSISCECYFTESCLYKIEDRDSEDVNKLFGFSNTLNPHGISARVGWNTYDDGEHIELFSYVHDDKEINSYYTRKIESLGLVKPNEIFRIDIIDQGDQYFFRRSYSDEIKIVDKFIPKQKTNNWFYILLSVYFGGDKSAPHDIKIFIRKL